MTLPCKPRTVIIAKQGIGEFFISLRAIELIASMSPEFGPILVCVSSPLLVEYIQESPLGRTVAAAVMDRGNALQLCLALRRAKPEFLLFMLSNGSWKHSAAAMIVNARCSIGSAYGTAAFGFKRVVDMRRQLHKAELCWEIAEIAMRGFSISMPALQDLESFSGQSLRQVPHTVQRRMVVLACGSGEAERHKRWPAQRFAELGVRLLRSYPDIQLTVLGSSAEKPVVDKVIAHWPASEMGRISASIPASIDESLEVLGRSSLVVSGCTGTIHMAAALGIPVVGIYGPTNPRFTGPFGTRAWIVRKDYRCAPCYRIGFISGCGQPHCITDISVEEVLEAVEGMLRGEIPPTVDWRQTTNAVRPIVRRYDQADGKENGQ